MQRDITPQAGRPRAASGHGRYQSAPSCARSRNSTSPPGSENRRLRSVTRAAMFGLAPSHTMRSFSSRLNPSMMRSFTNVPGLRRAFDQAPLHAAGHGVLGTEIVIRFVAKERADVARGGKADARDDRVVDRVEELVQLGRIEAVAQAHLGRVGCARERRLAAVGERPVGRRDLRHAALHARHRFRRDHVEREVGRVHRRGRITRDLVARDDDGLRVAAHVSPPRHERTADARAIGILGDGQLHRLVVRGRRHVALPSGHDGDAAVLVGRRGAVPPVHDRIEDHAVGLAHVDRLHQRERHVVLDHAPRVARRELEIGDDLVVRVVGTELAVRASVDALVLARLRRTTGRSTWATRSLGSRAW